jgi:hypothetical protein
VGGLPTGDDSDRRVVGGPEYVRATGIVESVAELAAGLVRSREVSLAQHDELVDGAAATDRPASDEISDEQVSRYCAAFSRLGRAQALLEAGRPERALAMLPPIHGRRLTESTRCDCADRSGNRPPGVEPCSSCRRFRTEDPAYLRLGGRDARLLQDAALIAVRCHLKVARGAALGDEDRGVDVAEAAVDAVLELARTAGLAARVRPEVIDFATTAVEAMVTARTDAGARLDRAVELITRVRGKRGLGNDETLRSIHGTALCDRAQRFVIGGDDLELPDYESAIADLRQAVRLSPTLLRAREGLAHTLVQRCTHRQWTASDEESLAEALAVASEGLRVAPGTARLLEAVKAVASQARSMIYRTLTEDELMGLPPPTVPVDESRTDAAASLARAARRAAESGDRRTATLLTVDAVLADPSYQPTRDTLADLLADHDDDRGTT